MGFSKKVYLIVLCFSALFIAGFFSCGYAQEGSEEIVPFEIDLSIRGTYVPFQSILSIYDDGRVTYIEEKGVGPNKEITKKSGKINEEEFINLTRLINGNNFFKLKKLYDDPKILDASYTTVTVKYGQQSYSVEEYAGSGPESFHNIVGKLSEIKEKSIF